MLTDVHSHSQYKLEESLEQASFFSSLYTGAGLTTDIWHEFNLGACRIKSMNRYVSWAEPASTLYRELYKTYICVHSQWLDHSVTELFFDKWKCKGDESSGF